MSVDILLLYIHQQKSTEFPVMVLVFFTVLPSYLFRLKERLCGVKESSPLCSENYVTSSVPFQPMELF